MTSSSSFFDLCLEPACDRETFVKEYFLKKPLRTTSSNSATPRFERHFRLTDLEFLWSTAMRVDPSSMLFFHKPSHPNGPVSNLRSAFFAFAHQISVVVNKADRLSPAILKICKSFEAHFPFVFCNVYSTPAGQQTVPLHVDDRDVFILQVHGAKHWTIYNSVPVVLPYKSEELGKNQPNSPQNFSVNDDEGDEGERAGRGGGGAASNVAFRGVVETGDVVYLPRGFPHVAKAVEHSASVHLTIAIQTSDWDVNAILQDGFEGAISELLRKSVVSSDVLESDRPKEFTLREVLPRSLLCGGGGGGGDGDGGAAGVNKNHNSSKQLLQNEPNFVAKLQSSLQLVVTKLSESPHLCLDYFNNRLAMKRQSRQEFFDENVANLRFFPLSLGSLVQWVNRVQIIQVTPIDKTNNVVGSISHVVTLRKQSHHLDRKKNIDGGNDETESGNGGTMQLRVSASVLEVMFLMQHHFSACPCTVAEMMEVFERNQSSAVSGDSLRSSKKQKMDFSLAVLCTAGFLLRNGCLNRVS